MHFSNLNHQSNILTMLSWEAMLMLRAVTGNIETQSGIYPVQHPSTQSDTDKHVPVDPINLLRVAWPC